MYSTIAYEFRFSYNHKNIEENRRNKYIDMNNYIKIRDYE